MSPSWPASNVELRPIESLVPYARNSRTHSPAQIGQLAASMREWGWTNPVLVDEDGTLIAGHGRILAAQQLGIAEVPTMVATGWSKAQIAAYRLADNRLALSATWDEELLKIELEDLTELGFDLPLIGFDPDELEKLFQVVPDVIPPDDFGVYNETISTEHLCPKCGYQWSGGKTTTSHGQAEATDDSTSDEE